MFGEDFSFQRNKIPVQAQISKRHLIERTRNGNADCTQLPFENNFPASLTGIWQPASDSPAESIRLNPKRMGESGPEAIKLQTG